MSVVRSSSFWVLPAVLSIGCSSEIDHAPIIGSDISPAADSRDSSETAPARGAATTSATGASICDAGASWGARRDLAFEGTTGSDDFVEAVNALIRQSDMAPIAVSSHMDPACVWMVAFSAPDAAGATEAAHATSFTPMQRHPAGLWTAAPQSTGWLRVVDRASRTVWIPIVDVTGSATYGEASCASLSAVRVSAAIPPSAATLSLMTGAGERTVRDLMGSAPSARGWDVHFTFSADISR